ncbi:MAG: hypothetical protein Q9221_003087 [Calogaya cf. arnoldii]
MSEFEMTTLKRPQELSEKHLHSYGGSNSSDTDSSHEAQSHDNSRFEAVLARVNLREVPPMVTRLRFGDKKLVRSGRIRCFLRLHNACKVVTPALRGSYNILFPIRFRDGTQWLLKLPANGADGWDEQSARALTSEVTTMKLIYNNSSVPVSRIYGYDPSPDNPIRCPYILMERIDGTPLHHVWFQKDGPPGSLNPFRERALCDIAKAMVQLNAFTFPKAGSLHYNTRFKTMDIGPYRKVDFFAEYDGLGSDWEETTTYIEQGPFVDPKQYFLASLDTEDTTNLHYTLQGQRKLLRLFIEWFFEATPDDDASFVLAHPDFNLQNILVGEDGSLRGFVDWDGVAAVPRCLGSEAYPLWLIPDWDPHWYNPISDEENGRCDMTPAELDIYREKYARFIEAAVRDQEIEQSCSEPVSDGIQQTPRFSRTRVSALARCLYIAANEPFSIPYNIPMLMEKIMRLTSDDDCVPPPATDEDGSSGMEEESKDYSTDTSSLSHESDTTASVTFGHLSLSTAEGSEQSIPTETALAYSADPLGSEIVIKQRTSPNYQKGIKTKSTDDIESKGSQHNLGWRSDMACIPFIILCLLYAPSLCKLSMLLLHSFNIFPTVILFASLLSSDTRFPSSVIICILAGQFYARILDTTIRGSEVNDRKRDGIISENTRVDIRSIEKVDRRRDSLDTSTPSLSGYCEGKVVDDSDSRARKHNTSDHSTRNETPLPGIMLTQPSPITPITTTSSSSSSPSSKEPHQSHTPQSQTQDPPHDDSTFIAQNIYNALYKGTLHKHHIKRLKVGFIRLLAELDGGAKVM